MKASIKSISLFLAALIFISCSLTVQLPSASAAEFDLSVSAINQSVSGNLYDLDMVKFVTTVRNNGTADIKDAFTVEFYYDNKLLDTITYTSGLEADGYVNISATVKQKVGFGMHKVRTVVNGNNKISETNKANNNVAKRIFVIDDVNPNPPIEEPMPTTSDIEVFGITLSPPAPKAGDSVTLNILVKNVSNTNLPGEFKGQIKIGNTLYTTGNLGITLAPNGVGKLVCTQKWTVPEGASELVATGNSDNAFTDTNPSNNTYTMEYNTRGSHLEYITYQAESGRTNAEKILDNSDRQRGTLSGEASGRQAVKLNKTNDYVEWTATQDANAIVVRASMPDIGLDDTRTLSISVNNKKIESLTLSTRYSWLYGSESEPTKNKSDGNPFHLYDDARLLLNTTIKQGDVIRLYKDAADTATYYAIDFIDLENVAAPKTMPAGFVSITDYGAKEGENCSAAIRDAINDAVKNNKKGIWIPKGNWGMHYINNVQDTGKVVLPPTINGLNYKFEIAGAGMWYSRLYAMQPGRGIGNFDDWGRNWGFDCQGQTVYYHDFMMEGRNVIRTEGGKPLVNGYGQDTVIENLWIEHSTIGFWVGGADRGVGEDFPAGLTKEQKQSKGLIIKNSRCRNTGADGINLCAGTTDALVENVNCRSNGDDSFAIWSEKDAWVDSNVINPGGCQGNTIKNCTAELPWRANTFGIYGGKNNNITDSIARDCVTYMGIMVDGQTHPCVAPSGTLTVERVTFERTSGIFWDQVWPAIGIYKNGSDQKVTFNNIDVLDTLYGVFSFEGTANVDFNNMYIDSFCKYTGKEPSGVWAMGFIGPFGDGTVNFTNVKQYNWGGAGESFFGNPRTLQNKSSVYIIKEGCNWDYNGPKN